MIRIIYVILAVSEHVWKLWVFFLFGGFGDYSWGSINQHGGWSIYRSRIAPRYFFKTKPEWTRCSNQQLQDIFYHRMNHQWLVYTKYHQILIHDTGAIVHKEILTWASHAYFWSSLSKNSPLTCPNLLRSIKSWLILLAIFLGWPGRGQIGRGWRSEIGSICLVKHGVVQVWWMGIPPWWLQKRKGIPLKSCWKKSRRHQGLRVICVWNIVINEQSVWFWVSSLQRVNIKHPQEYEAELDRLRNCATPDVSWPTLPKMLPQRIIFI